MWTLREASRACVVGLLALTISLLVNTVRKENNSERFDRELDAYGFCKITPSYNNSCVSVHGLLVLLSEFCGLIKEKYQTEESVTFREEVESVPDDSLDSDDESRDSVSEKPKDVPSREFNGGKPKEEPKEEERSPVIYQIIGLLLIVSVSFSLVECTKEKWARSKQAAGAVSTGGRKSLSGRQEAFAASRRMSLADLTISRHERRENQASYRHPAAEPRLWTRRNSMPGKNEGTKPVTRQVSWPHASATTRRTTSFDTAPEEDAWAERRRVRMLHRH